MDKIEELVEDANQLINKLDKLNIPGSSKLRNSIKAEIKFLSSLQPENLKSCHYASSNIPYLKAIVDTASREPFVTSLMEPLKISCRKVRLDIVSNHGLRWVKVNSSTFNSYEEKLHYYSGSDSEETESKIDRLVKQCQTLVQLSKSCMVHYKKPCVVVMLCGMKTIPEYIRKPLLAVGVEVETMKSQIPVEIPHADLYCSSLLLDVTSLIALCSNLSHPETLQKYKQFPVYNLQIQLEEELKVQLLPALQQVFQSRQLVTTRSAVEKLNSIASTVAGPIEKRRVEELLANNFNFNIRIIPDDPSARFLAGIDGINDLNRKIFGTGDHIKATVVSANSKVASLASEMGCSVFVHSPRSFVGKRDLQGNIFE